MKSISDAQGELLQNLRGAPKLGQFGLGRVLLEDPRDQGFLLEPRLAGASKRQARYWWQEGARLDQGNTPTCVGHAWAHWLEDGPITQPNMQADPFQIYRDAQKIDEWPGENYDGTSVRAGAKVLRGLGQVKSFLWAYDLDTTIQALLEIGPVVFGTWWYETMFKTHRDGRMFVGGEPVGGHAFLANGVSRKSGLMRFKNSWGDDWGMNGDFYLGFDDVARLIEEEGEVCIALELKTPAKVLVGDAALEVTKGISTSHFMGN